MKFLRKRKSGPKRSGADRRDLLLGAVAVAILYFFATLDDTPSGEGDNNPPSGGSLDLKVITETPPKLG